MCLHMALFLFVRGTVKELDPAFICRRAAHNPKRDLNHVFTGLHALGYETIQGVTINCLTMKKIQS